VLYFRPARLRDGAAAGVKGTYVYDLEAGGLSEKPVAMATASTVSVAAMVMGAGVQR